MATAPEVPYEEGVIITLHVVVCGVVLVVLCVLLFLFCVCVCGLFLFL